MDLPSKHVLYLAKKVGPRPAGSDGENAAASYVLRTMNEFDIDVDMESFSCWKSDVPALIAICLIGVVAFLSFRLNYLLSFFLSAFTFLVFQMEAYSWAVVSKLQPRSTASNVLGRVHATGTRKHRVFLVANYDTAKASPLGNRFLARAYRVLFIIAFISILLITLWSVVGVGLYYVGRIAQHTINTAWVVVSPFAVYLFLFSLLLFAGQVFGSYSAGANDNAAGVAVMLSVLASVAANPLESTEIWGVATARGAAGGRGTVALIKRHRRLTRESRIISIDHPGLGPLKVMRREGPMLGFRSSRTLRRIIKKAASGSDDIEIKNGRNRVKKGDAMAALARFRKAATIGGSSGGSHPGWRRIDDTYEHIERDRLDKVVKLLNMVLEEIDES